MKFKIFTIFAIILALGSYHIALYGIDLMRDVENQEEQQVNEVEQEENQDAIQQNEEVEESFIEEGKLALADAGDAQTNLDAYYQSLRAQIDNQDSYAQKLLQNMQKSVSSQIQRAEVEHALTMLDVKKTLYANFYDTETIKQSQPVRDALLQVMSKSDITVSDLASLQNLVKQEKERLGIK